MKKLNCLFLALFLLFLQLSISQDVVQEQENNCADNPLLPFLKKFIERQNQFIKEEEAQDYDNEDETDADLHRFLEETFLEENIYEPEEPRRFLQQRPTSGSGSGSGLGSGQKREEYQKKKEEFEKKKEEYENKKEDFEKRKEDYEKKKGEFEKKKEEYEKKKEELHGKTGEEYEKKKEEFQKKKEEYESKKEEFEKKREDYEQKKGEFEKKKEDYEKKREEFEGKTGEEYQKKKEEFEKKKEEYENKKEDFEKRKEDYEQKKGEFEKKKEEYEKKKEELDGKTGEEYEKKKKEFQKKKEEYEKKKEEFEKKREDYEQKKGEFEKKKEDFEKKKEEFEGKRPNPKFPGKDFDGEHDHDGEGILNQHFQKWLKKYQESDKYDESIPLRVLFKKFLETVKQKKGHKEGEQHEYEQDGEGKLQALFQKWLEKYEESDNFDGELTTEQLFKKFLHHLKFKKEYPFKIPAQTLKKWIHELKDGENQDPEHPLFRKFLHFLHNLKSIRDGEHEFRFRDGEHGFRFRDGEHGFRFRERDGEHRFRHRDGEHRQRERDGEHHSRPRPGKKIHRNSEREFDFDFDGESEFSRLSPLEQHFRKWFRKFRQEGKNIDEDGEKLPPRKVFRHWVKALKNVLSNLQDKPTKGKEQDKGKGKGKGQGKPSDDNYDLVDKVEKAKEKLKEIREKKKEIRKAAKKLQQKTIKKALKQEILKQFFNLDDVTAIENSSPAVQEGLGLCSSLEGKPSCCAKAQIQNFKKLTKGYYLRKLKSKPTANKLFERIKEKIAPKNEETIQTQEEAVCNIEDLVEELKDNEKVKSAYESQRVCQKKAIFVTNNLIRGTICQACMDPSELSRHFDGVGEDLKLKIVPESMQKYRNFMTEQFQCSKTAQQEFREALKEAVLESVYHKECTGQLETILALLEKEREEESAQEDKVCDSNPQFFDDGCLAELEDTTADGADDASRRVLQAGSTSSSSNYLEDENGVSGAYEEDPAEEQELQALPDAETPPPLPIEEEQNPEDPQQQQPSGGLKTYLGLESDASVLQYFGVLFMVLVLVQL